MTDNRRNHYRVLHVQPDAPPEVIKASWRTLLSQLRQHPDLGGSHGQAVIVNEAWAVLGDAARRAAYDLALGPAASVLQGRASATVSAGAAVGAEAGYRSPNRCHNRSHCPLCQQSVGGLPRPDSRCVHCHSPLASLPGPGAQGHELLGQRDAVRRDQGHVALVHVGWPSPALPVRWRDLSLTGLSFYAPQALLPGQRLRLIDSAIEGVVEVVGCRPQGRVFTVHARMLTALLLQSVGVFVSARA